MDEDEGPTSGWAVVSALLLAVVVLLVLYLAFQWWMSDFASEFGNSL